MLTILYVLTNTCNFYKFIELMLQVCFFGVFDSWP